MTYYAEAIITATGQSMCDDGLTLDQIHHLQAAQDAGKIHGLRYMADNADVQAMFAGSVRV